MRKVIAAINMSLDGYCDHTAMNADEELHQHFTELLRNAGTLLYGRITYELMLYWPPLVKNPTGEKSMDEFAVAIDKVPKVVFSRTLEDDDPIITGWKTARLAKRDLKDEVLELMQGSGKDIFVGSPSLIVALSQLELIDEYQLVVHPVVVGSGLPLFKNISDKIDLKLIKTKAFGSGAIALYYERTKR